MYFYVLGASRNASFSLYFVHVHLAIKAFYSRSAGLSQAFSYMADAYSPQDIICAVAIHSVALTLLHVCSVIVVA